MSKNQFEEVSLPKWKLAFGETAGKVYRVFKNEEEFEEIEASSANEAMQKSGLETAFQIKQGARDSVEVLTQEHLSEVVEELAADMPIEANIPASEAPPATA